MSRSPALSVPARRGLAAVAWWAALVAGAAAEPPGGGRLGMLEADGQRTLGWLVTAGDESGIAWQPAGGGPPVPLGAAARIRYRGLDALGGIGAGLARDGDCWRFVDVDAAGPAGRDGRIRFGDRLVTIAQGSGGTPIPTDDLEIDVVRGLVRGIIGSTVVVTTVSATGAEQRIELVRDELGRGDLAGAAPRDVLDRVLAIHDTHGAAGEADAGPATVHLRWGDSFLATVVAADRDGLRVRIAPDHEVTIGADLVRAVDLQPASGRPILKQKRDRLLTLPRMQKADPPTHLLRLTAGDYVRGRLVELGESTARLQVQAEEKRFARDQVARIIWLGLAGEPRPEARAAVDGLPGTAIQIVGSDGRRLTLAASVADGERVIGRSPALGAVRPLLARCAEILVGDGIKEFGLAELPYEKWVLTPAAVPRALAD